MSIYNTATLGATDNYLTFNDYTTNPVYRVTTRTPQRFQLRQDDIPIPFESGVSDFKTLIGSTIYVIRGTMYPQDESSYDSGLAALRALCSLDINQNDALSDNGYVPYTWGEVAGGEKTLFVKPLYVQIVEDTHQGFVQPFTIFCKVKDPIIYGDQILSSTQFANPSTLAGAAQYSFKYPIVYGSTTFTVNSTAYNQGKMPTYPIAIDIYGPVTNPVFTNTSTGEYLSVAVTLSSVSDVLHFEYNNTKQVVTLNGNSVVNKVSIDSTYWKVHPGNNVIQLGGSSVGTGAYANLSYRSGYALA